MSDRLSRGNHDEPDQIPTVGHPCPGQRQQFWQAFREDQQRLHGDKQQAVAERERKAQEKAREVAKD